MEITLETQSQGFFLACIVGFALGLLFDVFRVLRVLLRCERRPVFFQDLFCLTVAGIVTYLVALAVNWGEIRFFILAGEAIGICVYFLTVGEITVRIAKLIYKIIILIRNFIRKWIFMPIGKFMRRIVNFTVKKLINLKKRQKKVQQTAKIP